jgi:hypothetical protein
MRHKKTSVEPRDSYSGQSIEHTDEKDFGLKGCHDVDAPMGDPTPVRLARAESQPYWR